MKFIKENQTEAAKYTGAKRIEVELFDDVALPELFDAFKGFLQACGYFIDGEIDIVRDPDSDETEGHLA